MNCAECQEQIGDYVDGALDAAARARLDTHLAACPGCRATTADFAGIRAAARALEPLVPPARIWTMLEAAVERERRRRWWHAAAWRPALKPMVAAVLLLVVGGSFLWVWRRATPPPAPVAPARHAAAVEPELVQTIETELRLAEQHYDKAIAGLEQITRQEGAALDPQVASVLQKNLSVIDHAIGESRAALRAQPTNEVAQSSLFGALRSKVSLLQETVVLINEMRKGNQEGAARIVSGLNQ